VDYDVTTCNADVTEIEAKLAYYWDTDNPIKAMILAHTLGFPLDMDRLMQLCNYYNVRLIEDCCEALGSVYEDKIVGSFGDVGTVSFYSSHQISGFGGGGALLTNDDQIAKQAKSLRDWGKTSMFEGSHTTTMSVEVDGIPYDKQYSYETIGYNMRLPDVNCAYAREQLKKLPAFNAQRERNYKYLEENLKDLPLIQAEIPESPHYYTYPAYFGYPLILKEEGLRDKFVKHLEDNGVRVRLFFAGNILRHPPYCNLSLHHSGKTAFPNADYLMKNALFCGCWHGLTEEDMAYSVKIIKSFFNL
jgi:CDP-6-deoxy-D-xylo-4-hexulose-3-dehydrase